VAVHQRGFSARHGGTRERDLAWTRRLAQSRIALWTEQLARGQRPATPALLSALAVDRALVDRLTQELGPEDPRPPQATGEISRCRRYPVRGADEQVISTRQMNDGGRASTMTPVAVAV
jgi:hypothetical protein